MSSELWMGASRHSSGERNQMSAWDMENSPLAGEDGCDMPEGADDKSFYQHLFPDWNLVRRIIHDACAMSFYPAPFHIRLRRRIKLYLNCAAKFSALQAWHDRHSGTLHTDILKRHPLLPVLTRRPYINSTWPSSKKQAVIKGHYQFVRDRATVLSFPLDGEKQIASIHVDLPDLRLVLDKSDWFQNEGEVVLNLFIGETRAYSLAFSLGYENAQAVAYIGAIQGCGHGLDALQRNRLITRSAFGMRSRDLLFAAFRILCTELNIERILAADKASSVVDSRYFGGGTRYRHASYDVVWAEYGGIATEDSNMLEIPVQLRFRDLSDIPSKKKGMYRQRYQMLRALQSEIAVAIVS